MRQILSVIATVGFFAACGGGLEATDDHLLDQDDPVGMEDGVVRPIGSFSRSGESAGDLIRLTIMTDHTYHAETLVYCVKAPCYPVRDDGTYRFTKGGSTRYIRLYGPAGEKLHRYAYRFQGDSLYLRDTDQDGEWFLMTRESAGWCREAAQCRVQNLSQPRCPGEWTCTADNTCAYQCETQTACASAGGSCVPVVPGACQGGIIGDGAEYSCGGLLGVMCCLPSPKAPECKNAFTSQEGWYDPDSGDLLCLANCAGSAVRCGNAGTRSEGWYTDAGAGCGGGALIAWDNCASSMGS